jgi:hypothetical protein
MAAYQEPEQTQTRAKEAAKGAAAKPRIARARRGGMPRFTPTDQQRHLVTLCAGGMSQHEIARLVLNPRTNKPFNAETLVKYFPQELAVGTAKSKAMILGQYHQLIAKGSENSVLFGMRAVIGFDDRNPPVTMRLGVSGPDGKSSTINIEFVQPDPSRFRDDDEPARLPAPPRDVTPAPR